MSKQSIFPKSKRNFSDFVNSSRNTNMPNVRDMLSFDGLGSGHPLVTTLLVQQKYYYGFFVKRKFLETIFLQRFGRWFGSKNLFQIIKNFLESFSDEFLAWFLLGFAVLGKVFTPPASLKLELLFRSSHFGGQQING